MCINTLLLLLTKTYGLFIKLFLENSAFETATSQKHNFNMSHLINQNSNFEKSWIGQVQGICGIVIFTPVDWIVLLQKRGLTQISSTRCLSDRNIKSKKEFILKAFFCQNLAY